MYSLLPMVITGMINLSVVGTPIPTSGAMKSFEKWVGPFQAFEEIGRLYILSNMLGLIETLLLVYMLFLNRREGLRMKMLIFALIFSFIFLTLQYSLRSNIVWMYYATTYSRYSVSIAALLLLIPVPLLLSTLRKNLTRSIWILSIAVTLGIIVFNSPFYPCLEPDRWLHTMYERHYIWALEIKEFVDEMNLSSIGVSDVGYVKLVLPTIYVADIKGLNTVWVAKDKLSECRKCNYYRVFCFPENISVIAKKKEINYFIILYNGKWHKPNCDLLNISAEPFYAVPPTQDCNHLGLKMFLISLNQEHFN